MILLGTPPTPPKEKSRLNFFFYQDLTPASWPGSFHVASGLEFV